MMSDVGKITEIEPEDQLGWIEMENGDRVRFGGTACKGFVPEVGMLVKVLGTRPGYRGTVKATGLEMVKAASGAGPRAVAATAGGAAAAPPAGAAPATPAAAAPPPAPPRQSLLQVQNAGVRADDLLLQVLGRADMDDALHADLEALHFEVQPQPGAELGCNNPWVYVVAMDGSGNAYALYQHPIVAEFPNAPWVFWDHETDHVRYLAPDTGSLLQSLLAEAAAAGGPAAAAAPRAQATMVKLGMPDQAGGAIEPQPIEWLPPEDSQLRSLDEYLGESDGAEMERGLLAYVSRKQDARAKEALKGLYDAWGWSAPGL